MQVTTLRLFFVLIIVGGFCSAAFAQLTSSEVESMSKSADLIITGKVTQQNSSWNETKTRIYTTATIQVEESLKGSSQNLVEVRYPGGEVGDVGELYSHMPKFENDEDVLVFLKKDKTGSNYNVFNGENGKIRLINDPQTGEKITASNIKVNTLKTQIKAYIND